MTDRYQVVTTRPGGLEHSDSLIIDNTNSAVVAIVYDPVLADAAAAAFDLHHKDDDDSADYGPTKMTVGQGKNRLIVDVSDRRWVLTASESSGDPDGALTAHLLRRDVERVYAALGRWLADD